MSILDMWPCNDVFIKESRREGAMSMIIRTCCPACGSKIYKQNGKTHYGKQNHKCKNCGRAFVLLLEQEPVPEAKKSLTGRLLLERLSLRGICRAVKVSLGWLIKYMVVDLFDKLPEHIHIETEQGGKDVVIHRLEAEVDEMSSFVGHKQNKQWIWVALDRLTKKVIAFHVGDRSKRSARKLWETIPASYKKSAVFYTDLYASYEGVIPTAQHKRITKEARLTNHVERLFCTMRQRISRLVRASLSFSKKQSNHIGAIKYFLYHYNIAIEASS